MAAYLEVWTPADQKFVTLAAGPAGRDTAVAGRRAHLPDRGEPKQARALPSGSRWGREYRPLVQLSRLREAVISGWRDGRWRWLRLRWDPGPPAAAKPPGTS